MTVQGIEIEPIGRYAVACGGGDGTSCANDAVVRIEGIAFCGSCARVELRAIGFEPAPENEERIR